jgi:hypothetical protein
LFLVLFLGIIAGAGYAVNYEAHHTFYVGFDADRVVIFKGRPGGVLWIDPTVDSPSDITRDKVPPARLDQLEQGKRTGSKEEAQAFIDALRNQINELDVGSTTTTTTPSTTVPAPVTPGVPGTTPLTTPA